MLVSSLVAGLIAEVGLRVAETHSIRVARLLYLPQVRTHFESVPTTAELLAESALGYHPLGRTPGFVLNSRGVRTHEYRREKEPGSLRVIALGDSFTFDSHAVPIGQMWHQVCRRLLSEALGREVEVISLSAPGVGPRFGLRLWELEGLPLSPDLVVLAFFVGNDFTDESGLDLEVGFESTLVRWSRLARLLRNVVRLRGTGVAVETAPAGGEPRSGVSARGEGGYELPEYAGQYDPNVPTFKRAAFLDLERARVESFAGPPVERFERLFLDTAMVVERMAREVELSGARFLVMIIPDEAQVNDHLWQEVASRFPPGTPLDRTRPQRMLGRYFDERGITRLDLLPSLRAQRVSLYKPRDTHWTARGNEVAGAVLADFVVERQLLASAQGP